MSSLKGRAQAASLGPLGSPGRGSWRGADTQAPQRAGRSASGRVCRLCRCPWGRQDRQVVMPTGTVGTGGLAAAAHGPQKGWA